MVGHVWLPLPNIAPDLEGFAWKKRMRPDSESFGGSLRSGARAQRDVPQEVPAGDADQDREDGWEASLLHCGSGGSFFTSSELGI